MPGTPGDIRWIVVGCSRTKMLSSATIDLIAITGVVTSGFGSSESRRIVFRSRYVFVPEKVVSSCGWFAHTIRSTFTHGFAESTHSFCEARHVTWSSS